MRDVRPAKCQPRSLISASSDAAVLRSGLSSAVRSAVRFCSSRLARRSSASLVVASREPGACVVAPVSAPGCWQRSSGQRTARNNGSTTRANDQERMAESYRRGVLGSRGAGCYVPPLRPMSQDTSTKPPSGMRDFLAADVVRRRHVTSIVQRVYESFGFVPLETPAIENLSSLLGKYGPEGDQLLYRILHRRDKLLRALEGSPREQDLAEA